MNINNKRLLQLRQSWLPWRSDLKYMISDLNKPIIEKIWEGNIKKYIQKLFVEKNFSLKDIEKLALETKILWWKTPSSDLSILQILYKILTENIIFPNYTENNEDFEKEISEILKRTKHKIERLIKESKWEENWFFSIFYEDIDSIYDEFMYDWNIQDFSINLGWIFWFAEIKNNLDWWFFEVTIPVRISDWKVKVWKNNKEEKSKNSISENELDKILSKILEGSWSEKYFPEKIFWKNISVNIEKALNRDLWYWRNEKDVFKVLRVFSYWNVITDDMTKEKIIALLKSVLSASTSLINKIANSSGIEHKRRIIDYTWSFVEYFSEKDEEDEKSKVSDKILNKYEKLKVPKDQNIKLEDVWGQEEAKKEVDKIIKSIVYREIMESWWAKSTSWIVFEWSPGTWKTLLAKALASEINAETYNIKLTDIATSAYINEWANNIKDLFTFIRHKSEDWRKIVIILDELDALFKKRWGLNESWEDTKIVNTFLTEMSWFKSNNNVIFIWTTNLIENIDPAVIRSWRLTTKVKVKLPDAKAREEIFKIHLWKIIKKSSKFENSVKNINLEEIAKKSDWLSWADIEEVVRILAEEKAMQEISWEKILEITIEDFERAIKKVKTEEKPKKIWFF